MMKIALHHFSMFMLAALAVLALTSCGDDDPDEPDNPNNRFAECTFTATFNTVIVDIMDITAVVDDNGTKVSQPVTSTTWEYQCTRRTTLPATFSVQFKYAVKPERINQDSYDISLKLLTAVSTNVRSRNTSIVAFNIKGMEKGALESWCKSQSEKVTTVSVDASGNFK